MNTIRVCEQALDPMKIGVLLLMAGSGQRFSENVLKPYAEVGGKSLVSHCIQHLAREPRVALIQPVISEQDQNFGGVEKNLEGRAKSLLLSPVHGGITRSHSMLNGLNALQQTSVEWLAVHDCARAFPPLALLESVFDAAQSYGAAVPGIPVTDTIKLVDEDKCVVDTPRRSRLLAVQTPQVARVAWFQAALDQFGGDLSGFTDDASLLEAAGYPVHVCEGSVDNRKVTYTSDLVWAEKRAVNHGV